MPTVQSAVDISYAITSPCKLVTDAIFGALEMERRESSPVNLNYPQMSTAKTGTENVSNAHKA